MINVLLMAMTAQHHHQCVPRGPTTGPPSIPNSLKYFGYWAANDDELKGLNNVNFYFDWPTNVDAVWDSHCGPTMQCMPIVSALFVDSKGALLSDYQARWDAAAVNFTVRLKQSKLLGFMLGDELLYHGTSLNFIQ